MKKLKELKPFDGKRMLADDGRDGDEKKKLKGEMLERLLVCGEGENKRK